MHSDLISRRQLNQRRKRQLLQGVPNKKASGHQRQQRTNCKNNYDY
mgnify:CR=1 FL=1